MKKIVAVIFLALSLLPLKAEEKGIETADLKITASHPRLLADDKDFKAYMKVLEKGNNKYLRQLHEMYMDAASSFVKNENHLEYTPNSSGKLLNVSRDALLKIFSCAYAYRISGDKRYLYRAEDYMSDVCDFETWHPEHYLDVAEMSLAVALGYDWLYRSLSKGVKEKAETALSYFALDPAEDPKFRKKFVAKSNWSQVLNAGLIATCAAIYEKSPARCDSLMRRAVKDNLSRMDIYYGPDGIYPEGAMYWAYGTGFQIMTNALLTKLYGTDFGLSEGQGFDRTAQFEIFTAGNLGRRFNYSDGGDKAAVLPQLWYFADKYQDYSILYPEIGKMANMKSFKDRIGALFLLYCAKCDPEKIVPPSVKVFSGRGECPLVMARTGWDRKDLYLGVKGGKASNNHGHMDAGSFVFEADGVRWICELSAPGYSVSEKALASKGKSLWNMSQDSWRWKILGYGNREHNTLTVNDKDHIVGGIATLDEVFDNETELGGRFNLVEVFGGDLAKASRKVVIKDGSYLEVTDVLAAPADRSADVRGTFITKSSVQVSEDGITLSSGGKNMKLHTEGAEVEYRTWSTNPKDYDNPAAFFQNEKKGTYLCGYTVTIPAGKEIALVTTLKKL